MRKAFEERRKVKQNYWFLTNETAYLNGQQPDGRRHRRRGRRRRGEPEVRGKTAGFVLPRFQNLIFHQT